MATKKKKTAQQIEAARKRANRRVRIARAAKKKKAIASKPNLQDDMREALFKSREEVFRRRDEEFNRRLTLSRGYATADFRRSVARELFVKLVDRKSDIDQVADLAIAGASILVYKMQQWESGPQAMAEVDPATAGIETPPEGQPTFTNKDE